MRVPWLADVLVGAGLTVETLPGWQGRGAEMTAVHGVVWHHTATGPNARDDVVANLLRLGHSTLPGPLAQLGLDRRGRYWVVADGRCNHNGYGYWGNNSLAIEAFNDGIGEPWPGPQVDAYIRGTAAILTRLGFDVAHMAGHKETDPIRKRDPFGLPMDRMRTLVAGELHEPLDEEDDMTRDVDVPTGTTGRGFTTLDVPYDHVTAATAIGFLEGLNMAAAKVAIHPFENGTAVIVDSAPFPGHPVAVRVAYRRFT
jgi:hypothetical protein